MSDKPSRAIEVEIVVPGTPEQVWQAIATGPGISSWYVPHTIEEREGGAMTASFGPGPEMEVTGRVAAWEPPHRLLLDGGEGAGLAFEWLIEARDGGSCVVRLVNTGFGEDESWDEQFDGMSEGWKMFLINLRLHLEHFAGEHATAMLPTAMWNGPKSETWATLMTELGLTAAPTPGDRVITTAADAPTLEGVVADAAASRVALILDRPAPGTAFIAVEGDGDHVEVSIWVYLYGPDATSVVARDEPLWRDWLARHGAPPN